MDKAETTPLALGQVAGAPPPGPEPRPDTGLGIRFPVIVGISVIGLFFGAFGLWAAFSPLDSAAIAPGVVTVDSNRKTIQHLEGGIVDKINIREGQRVAAGDVLVRLDRTQAKARLDLLSGKKVAAAAFEARLIAERDDKSEINFPDWLFTEAASPETEKVLDSEVNIFEIRRKALAGETSILKQRIGQFGEEIKGLRGQIKAEDKQLELIKDELDGLRDLFEKGFARKPRLLALQREASVIEGSRSQNVAAIARAKQSISEVRLRIGELRTKLVNEVVQQLGEVQAELFDLGENIISADDVLKRTEIRAPLDGTVVDLQVHTTGGVIAPGEKLMDIVPSGDRLVVEARIDPSDIDVVHPGLTAQIRFSSFNQRISVPINGKVTSVSADILVDERTGASYYRARVELTEDFEKVFEGQTLYPGMPAEVMIVTGASTALDYFLRPITRSLNRAFRED